MAYIKATAQCTVMRSGYKSKKFYYIKEDREGSLLYILIVMIGIEGPLSKLHFRSSSESSQECCLAEIWHCLVISLALPIEEEGGIYTFKWFLPAFSGERVSTLWLDHKSAYPGRERRLNFAGSISGMVWLLYRLPIPAERRGISLPLIDNSYLSLRPLVEGQGWDRSL